jgi:DNA-binding NarL/FixJ family response regulator
MTQLPVTFLPVSAAFLEPAAPTGDNALCTFRPTVAGRREGLTVMSIRVAVFDPLPIYRRGVMAALGETGLLVEAPGDPLAWIRRDPRPVVFLTLEAAADWQLLAELARERSNPIVLAVLTDANVQSYLRALAAGAVAAIPRDATAEQLQQVFELAVSGRSLLPVDVVRALTGSAAPKGQPVEGLSGRDVDWLRDLARGTTVTRLAEKAGYSERAMFRLLQDLYRRMGVRNRTEALIQANERGLL